MYRVYTCACSGCIHRAHVYNYSYMWCICMYSSIAFFMMYFCLQGAVIFCFHILRNERVKPCIYMWPHVCIILHHSYKAIAKCHFISNHLAIQQQIIYIYIKFTCRAILTCLSVPSWHKDNISYTVKEDLQCIYS